MSPGFPGGSALPLAGLVDARNELADILMLTIKNITGPYRFFFYSFDCNEPRHIHVQRGKMTCKFWLEPIALCRNRHFSPKELNQIRKMIQENLDEIVEAWHEHCG